MPPQFNLLKAKEDLERAIVFAKQSKNEEKNREFFGAMIQTFGKIMSTTMQAISDDVRTVKDEMRKTVEAVKQVKIENQINVAKPDIPKAEVTVNNPPMIIPKQEIKVSHDPIVIPPIPEIETKGIEQAIERAVKSAFKGLRIEVPVSNVKIPPISVPEVIMPQEMQVKGEVGLINDRKNPIYAQLVDPDGKPYVAMGAMMSGGSRVQEVKKLPIDTYSDASEIATLSGNTTIVTPASGRRIRLHYLEYSADGANSADVTVYLRFGASGGAKYRTSLKAGSVFARNVGAGRRYIQGGIDEALIVNLSAGQTVNISVEYEEV